MRTTLARLGGLAVASSLILGACGSSASTAAPSAAPTTAPGATTAPAASEASTEPVNLEFWYWAESDAPGADGWMAETVADIFTEVERGRIHYGVVPVESSMGGAVSDTLDRFMSSNLKIINEVMGGGLRVLNRIADSPLVERLGFEERAQKLI